MVKTVKVTLSGQTYNLTLDSASGKYKATLIAPAQTSWNVNAGHYYPVTVEAEDNAGNKVVVNDSDAQFGASLKLRVKETVAPVIALTYPTSAARITNSKPTFAWTVTDDGSGVDSSKLSITINGTKITSGITATPTANGYSCTYTPASALPEGQNTVALDAEDHDGNKATQVTAQFIVDTVAPTLSVTSPVNGTVTNESTVTVAGVTNDETSSPVSVAIKVNNVDQGPVQVSEGGAFSKVVTLTSGTNTIEITATDAAGKVATVTRTVEVDTAAPTIKAITLTPNPADCGETLIITVTVEDE